MFEAQEARHPKLLKVHSTAVSLEHGENRGHGIWVVIVRSTQHQVHHGKQLLDCQIWNMIQSLPQMRSMQLYAYESTKSQARPEWYARPVCALR